MTWDEKADRKLAQWTAEGVTQRDIAKRLKTTPQTVRGRTRKLGIYTDKPSRIWHDREKPEQIAADTERLRVAVLGCIARYANDNGLDIDAAARRLLSGAGA